MRQTGRIVFRFKSCEWLFVLLVIAPRFTTGQYASSAYYNSQFYDHNQQRVQQQLLRSRYPDVPVSYNQQYPTTVASVWSSAPIVVNDEANTLLQQDRRYLPINYDNNGQTGRSNHINNNYDNYNNILPTTRAANHNYNNVPVYVYNTQAPLARQPQPQPRPLAPPPHLHSQQEVEQRELLAVADTRREEEQIVRIGGNGSLANNNFNNNYPNNNNYFEPPQSLQPRDFAAKYVKHYSDYLRKYPQRLQPFYNTGSAYVDK